MRMLSLGLCALTFAAAAAADAPGLKADRKDDVDQQLMKVEHAWNEALKSRDRAAFAAICSEDFVFTGEDGKVLDLKRFVDEATTKVKILDYKVTEPLVRSYGDTGVVSALWKGSVEVDGQHADAALRFTDTFVRRNGRWWAVASHMSRESE
ncbi:MAG TPA: nuclear transport factor 2 family protein [Chthonomonadaceae bacterium]|nr:nuclear transport factor 2 family protein [Chthonomonadaceae bacterium]